MNRLLPATWLRPAPLSLELDRFFQDFLEPTRPLAAGAPALPAMNVRETNDAFEVEMELPGLALDEIEVVFERRELTVRGERKSTLPEGAAWKHRERFEGKFSRSLRFAVDIDAARVQASLNQGLLRVTLPKPEAAKETSRRIEIRNGKD